MCHLSVFCRRVGPNVTLGVISLRCCSRWSSLCADGHIFSVYIRCNFPDLCKDTNQFYLCRPNSQNTLGINGHYRFALQSKGRLSSQEIPMTGLKKIIKTWCLVHIILTIQSTVLHIILQTKSDCYYTLSKCLSNGGERKKTLCLTGRIPPAGPDSVSSCLPWQRVEMGQVEKWKRERERESSIIIFEVQTKAVKMQTVEVEQQPHQQC